MKLDDCHKARDEFSKTASELSRKLAFAAIALIWIFKYDSDSIKQIPKELYFPTLMIVTSLTILDSHEFS